MGSGLRFGCGLVNGLGEWSQSQGFFGPNDCLSGTASGALTSRVVRTYCKDYYDNR